MTTRRIATFIAATVAAGTTAALLAGTLTAGHVTAPEPASLSAPLSSTSGATAQATFVYSKTPTNAVLWSGSWTSGGWIVPGTPCSTVPLAPGDVTTKVIQALFSSGFRRCV